MVARAPAAGKRQAVQEETMVAGGPTAAWAGL